MHSEDDPTVAHLRRTGQDLRRQFRQHARQQDSVQVRTRRVPRRIRTRAPDLHVRIGSSADAVPEVVVDTLRSHLERTRVVPMRLLQQRQIGDTDGTSHLSTEKCLRLRQPAVAEGYTECVAESRTEPLRQRQQTLVVAVEQRALLFHRRRTIVDLDGEVEVSSNQVRSGIADRGESVQHRDEVLTRRQVGRVRTEEFLHRERFDHRCDVRRRLCIRKWRRHRHRRRHRQCTREPTQPHTSTFPDPDIHPRS